MLDLEQQIGDLATLFDPVETRDDFLPWLSSWVAFTLRADRAAATRAFIARIIPALSPARHQANLQDLLSIFTGDSTISSSPPTMRRTLNIATMRLPHAAPDILQRQTAIAHALIELEKPAHTDFRLDLLFPTMQIGVTSHIGIDTLLGTGGDTDTTGAIAFQAFTSNQRP